MYTIKVIIRKYVNQHINKLFKKKISFNKKVTIILINYIVKNQIKFFILIPMSSSCAFNAQCSGCAKSYGFFQCFS